MGWQDAPIANKSKNPAASTIGKPVTNRWANAPEAPPVDRRPLDAQTPDFTPAPPPQPPLWSSVAKAIGLPSPEAAKTAGAGIAQIKRGTGLGGGLNLFVVAPFQQAFSQLSGLSELAHRVPGLDQAASVLETPFNAIGSAGSSVAKSLYDFSGSGATLSPPERAITKEAVGQTGAIGAQMLAGELGAKGAEFISNIPKRAIRSGDVAFDRAFPTTRDELTRPSDRARMRPYLGEEQAKNPVREGVPDNSVARQLQERVFPDIKNRIINGPNEMIARNQDYPIVSGPDAIANSVESLSNVYTKNIDLLKDKSILDEAQKYRDMGTITLGEAHDMLKSLNAGLQKFYNMSEEGRAALENQGKPIAEMEKAAGAIRDQISRTLQHLGEDAKWYRERMLDYGSAARLEGAVRRNIASSEQPLPPFFTERKSTIYPSRSGIAREIGEHTIGRFYTPDKLAAKALDKYSKFAGNAPNTATPVYGFFPVSNQLTEGTRIIPYNPETYINVAPADVVQPLTQFQKQLPGPSQVQLPAQYPNEFTPATSFLDKLGKPDLRRLIEARNNAGGPNLLPPSSEPISAVPPQPPTSPQNIGDIFPNYKAPTVMELPKEDFPVQFKNSTEAINYGQNATKEQAAQLKKMRDLALRKGKKAGNSDQVAQWNTHAQKYREALEEYQKANAPKSGSQPDFASYRKYLANGGDLNFSDWKAKGRPSK